MPTRTQTSKRPSGRPFARLAGKSAQRPGGGRRTPASRRPTMITRRTPQKSGAANVAGKIGSLLSGTRAQRGKPGAAGSRGKKGTAGVALLAGAAGLLMKNRAKLTSMIRKDSSDEGADRVQPRPIPGPPAPTETSGVAGPLGSPDHPTS
jgi:hypothetical protein